MAARRRSANCLTPAASPPLADDDKLLSSYAPHQVSRAHRSLQHLGDLAQHSIAGLMAVAIVDALEMVDVGNQQMRRLGLARSEAVLQCLVQAPAVEQLGQGIARGNIAQVVAEAAQHQPDDGRWQHRGQE